MNKSREAFLAYATKHHNLSSLYVGKEIEQIENMTRTVIEERSKPFKEIDVFSRLIMDRIVFLGTEVNDHVANIIVAQLLFLESVDREKEITLYINSPGGSVYAGLGIYDTMQYIKPVINTICTGISASMAAIILAGGSGGRRAALPHSRILIHQPLGGTQGQATEMEITVKQIISIRNDLYNILVKHTKKPFATIQQDAERDYWLTAEEAKAYGLIDHVLTTKK